MSIKKNNKNYSPYKGGKGYYKKPSNWEYSSRSKIYKSRYYYIPTYYYGRPSYYYGYRYNRYDRRRY